MGQVKEDLIEMNSKFCSVWSEYIERTSELHVLFFLEIRMYIFLRRSNA